MLTESRDATVIPMVLSAPSTASMNFVTAQTVYCLYPNLTAERRALTKWDVPQYQTGSLLDRGIDISDTMEKWNLPCTTESCGVRQWNDRRRGIGKFHWSNIETVDEWEQYMKGSCYRWRRGLWCTKILCDLE